GDLLQIGETESQKEKKRYQERQNNAGREDAANSNDAEAKSIKLEKLLEFRKIGAESMKLSIDEKWYLIYRADRFLIDDLTTVENRILKEICRDICREAPEEVASRVLAEVGLDTQTTLDISVTQSDPDIAHYMDQVARR